MSRDGLILNLVLTLTLNLKWWRTIYPCLHDEVAFRHAGMAFYATTGLTPGEFPVYLRQAAKRVFSIQRRKMVPKSHKVKAHAWGFNASREQPLLLRAWDLFIQTGKIETKIVPPHIAESWVRSRYYGVDPFCISAKSYLTPADYQERISQNRQLIHLSTPILENVFKSFGAAQYVVSLYDKDGYHMIRLGQPEDVRIRAKHGVRAGLCFDENHLGTCGFALAKRLKRAVRVTGCEHYLSLLHQMAGVYSPILDPLSKELIGVIAVGGADLVQYPHAESIVIAASTAIENLLELDRAKRELSIYSESLQIAIDFLEDGVMVFDNRGCLFEVNLSARQALGLGRENIRGRHIAELSPLAPLKDIVMDFIHFPGQEERQTEFQIRSQSYLVKVKGVRQARDDLLGVLIQMKNVRHLSRLFQNMTGDQPRYSLESIIGSSKAIREVRKLADIASKSDVPVIIEGESGTGKEVVAQAIHNASSRRGKPFVAVNCVAIPSELLESTIFGHEKGAFTGAVGTHIGKFELADGGTLFLDEIAEMSMGMQAKLLRAIEERRVERVGGKEPFPVDVRILSASNKNIYLLVQKQLFREDLFYRLNVFRIVLPPLREHREDIGELARLFIEQFVPVFKKNVARIHPEFMNSLQKYDWPGNIRELRNAIQYSMARLNGEALSPADIEDFFCHPPTEISSPAKRAAKGKRLLDIERQVILEELEFNKNNKSKTARSLGIGRWTLYRKLNLPA
jgi:transcriptional regulator with PAS, ATPase and Fis domain